MRLKLLTSLIFCLTAVCAYAVDPGRAFITAPESRFPFIPQMKRMDMIDYFRAGVTKPSQNLLRGNSRILSETPNSITVEEVADRGVVTTINIAKGAARGDSVLIVVSNFEVPAGDGSVSVYNTSWKSLPGNVFTPPALDDWLIKRPAMDKADLENYIPFVTASAEFDPETDILTFTNTLDTFLGKDIYDKVKDSVRPVLKYRWTGRKMVRID